MDKLILLPPQAEHQAAAQAYLEEHRQAGELLLHGAAGLEEATSYADWLRLLYDPAALPEGWVPATTFWGLRESDGQIVGVINIRHRLNEALRAYGGNIGYGVRPSARRRGYATQMLRLALPYCWEQLGLASVMLACYADNMASRRTIEQCGGVWEREFADQEGRLVWVYWIHKEGKE